MQPKTKKLLADMASAAAFIARHTEGVSLDSYVTNDFLRLSVERQFEVIGEAARRIAVSDPAAAAKIAALPRIIAFRNLLAHGYDEIDHARVIAIVRTELPEMRESVDRLLDRGE
jgi:uncharacterized protein with HEPN domain